MVIPIPARRAPTNTGGDHLGWDPNGRGRVAPPPPGHLGKVDEYF